MSFRRDVEGLIAISLISSMGSVPLHLATVLVQDLVANYQFTVTEANLLITAYFCGELLIVFLLSYPRKGSTGLSAKLALGIYAIAFFFCTVLQSPVVSTVLWFVIGVCSGKLMFAGFEAAAASRNAKSVFSLRLSFALIISGILAMTIVIFGITVSYGYMCAVMGSFAVIVSVSAHLFNVTEPRASQPQLQPHAKVETIYSPAAFMVTAPLAPPA